MKEYLGTIVVLLIIVIWIALVIRHLIKNRNTCGCGKKSCSDDEFSIGTGGCSGSCSSCAFSCTHISDTSD